MIRIDALWLCAQPVKMRAGAERLLAAVISTLGQARARHRYLSDNARATRVELLVHDGLLERARYLGNAGCCTEEQRVRAAVERCQMSAATTPSLGSWVL